MEDQAIQPLEEIGDIESDIQQFLHLDGMDCFMIVVRLVDPVHQLSPNEDYTEEINKKESSKRDDIIQNNSHQYTTRITWYVLPLVVWSPA